MKPLGINAFVPALLDPFSANVRLLLHADGVNDAHNNTFLDSSTNNFTVTVGGTPTQGSFSPYAAGGGSGAFNGSTDYLSLPANAFWTFGLGPFTVEAWVYRTASGVQHAIASDCDTANSGSWLFALTVTNKLQFGSYSSNLITGATTFTANVWHHVAVTYDGTNYRLFLDGVLDATAAGANNFSNSGQKLFVGHSGQVPQMWMQGFVSDVRIFKGTALWTASFLPSTAPLTASGAHALLSFTNAAIFDTARKTDVRTNGSTKISTAQKKFGTGAIVFQGSAADYIAMGGPGLLPALGSGDFTIEFWLYLSAGGTVQIFDWRDANWGISPSPVMYYDGSALNYYTTSALRITSSAFSTGVWRHVAISRVAGNTRLFINGTQQGVTYADATNYIALPQRPVFGASGYAPGTANMSGYIDDIRITIGVGRYNANFTAPAAEFPYP